MMKKAKIVFLLMLALVFALQSTGMPAARAETIGKLTVDYIFDGLGDALNYGVVAEEYTQSNHAETSVFVDKLIKAADTPFLNTETTYMYGRAYPLYATVSAPSGESLQGMQFALFTANGSQMTMCEDTLTTITEDTNVAAVGWRFEEDSPYLLHELYVRQVEQSNGGYRIVNEGEWNSDYLQVSYGPDISTAAPSSSYIGSMQNGAPVGSSIKFYNTMAHNPPIEFGPGARLCVKKYHWVPTGNYWEPFRQEEAGYCDVTAGTANGLLMGEWLDPNGQVYIRYSDAQGETRYDKFEDKVFFEYNMYTGQGAFYFEENGQRNYLEITSTQEDDKAARLLEKARAFSQELGNMEGGVVNYSGTDILNAEPSILGNSTVTGPEDANGNVVSLYTVELNDWAFDETALQASIGQKKILIAPNEYVVFNVVCDEKTGYVDMMPGAIDLYIYEAGKADQAQWGKEDSGASDRVLFNFVYLDESTGTYKPFEGTINPTSQHGGTVLAPSAHIDVNGDPPNGALIGKTVINRNGTEIHQRTMTSPAQTTWVNMVGRNAPETGEIKLVKKQGTTLENLPGATFALYADKACTQQVGTEKTTDAQGVALFTELESGIYYLKETKAPAGYTLDTTVYTVEVRAGVTSLVGIKGYVTNTSGRGALTLTKVDAENTQLKLKGAKFGLYTQKSSGAFDEDSAKLVQTLTTDGNGRITVRVEAGEYWIRELEAPFGYAVGMGEAKKITVEVNKTTVVETSTGSGVVTNEKLPTGTLRITKVDLDKPSLKLDGAEFAVYRDSKCTKQVATLRTANGGLATAELPTGTYWVREITAPSGYVLDASAKYEVEITAGQITDLGEDGVVTNEIIKGEVYLLKVGLETDPFGNINYSVPPALLSGAEFTVYSSSACTENDIVASALTDDEGRVSFLLAPGQYWFKETMAPLGYVISDTAAKEFFVNAGGEPQQVRGDWNSAGISGAFANTKKSGTGSLVLYKTDSSGRVELNGAEFMIYYDQECKNPVTKQVFVTKDVGRHKGRLDITGLESGTYYLLETKAPKGYKLPSPNKPIEVTIEKNKETRVNGAHGVVTNEGLADEVTSVTVTKVWDHTGNPMPSYSPRAELQLAADGEPMRGAGYTQTLTGDASYTWEDLPKYRYDSEADEWVEVVYTVIERDVPSDYKASISSTGENAFTVKNTYIRQDQTLELEIPVSKAMGSGSTDDVFVFELAQESSPPGPLPVDGDTTASVQGAGDATEDTFGKIVIDYLTFDHDRNGYSAITYGWSVREVIPDPANPVIEYDDTVYYIDATVYLDDNGRMCFGEYGDNGLEPKPDKVSIYKYGDEGNREYLDLDLTRGDRLTFTNNVKITSVSVKKQWVDDNNKEGKRPESVEVRLLANGVPQEPSVLLSGASAWEYTWENLSVKDNGGALIEYSVEEISQTEGYIATVSGDSTQGFVITNTLESLQEELGDISVKKVWVDNNNVGQLRPASIEATLLMPDGTGHATVAVLSETNGWSFTWEDLPLKDANGTELQYQIVESVSVPGYTVAYSGDIATGFVITNTINDQGASDGTCITVDKTWDDNNNAANLRPAAITVKLLANGTEMDAVELSESNGWAYTWDTLPAADAAGMPISYTLEEAPVPGYTAMVQQDPADTNSWHIVNTYRNGSVQFSAAKVMENSQLQPGQFAFELRSADGSLLQTVYNAADGSVVFDPIDFTEEDLQGIAPDASGMIRREINYAISEVIPQEAVQNENGNFYLNGIEYDSTIYMATAVLTYNPATGTFTAAPGYSTEDGSAPTFTNGFVSGEDVPGGEAWIFVSVTKVWNDNNNAAGQRPESIEVILNANDQIRDSVLLNESNAWTHTWLDLPLKDDQGTVIKYTVQEVPVAGYTSLVTEEYGRYTIINTYDGGEKLGTLMLCKTDRLDPAKVLAGAQYALYTAQTCKPEEMLILPDGTQAVITTSANGWGILTGIPEGIYWLQEIQAPEGYELDPMAYEVEITVDTAEPVRVTVSDFPLRGALSLSKTVVGDVPAGETFLFDVELSAEGDTTIAGSYEATLNGVPTEAVTFASSGTGKALATVSLKAGETLVIHGLRAGVAYTVAEKPNALYDVQVNGMAAYAAAGSISAEALNVARFQNTVKKVSFAVRKEWSGLGEGEKTPAITLTLYCNGQVYPAPTPAPDKNGWYTYTGLPTYVNGQLAVYTVKEQPVTGFTTAYLNTGANASVTDCAHNGSTIVNSKIPQTGDTAPLTLWLITALLAAFGLAGVRMLRRRREN